MNVSEKILTQRFSSDGHSPRGPAALPHGVLRGARRYPGPFAAPAMLLPLLLCATGQRWVLVSLKQFSYHSSSSRIIPQNAQEATVRGWRFPSQALGSEREVFRYIFSPLLFATSLSTMIRCAALAIRRDVSYSFRRESQFARPTIKYRASGLVSRGATSYKLERWLRCLTSWPLCFLQYNTNFFAVQYSVLADFIAGCWQFKIIMEFVVACKPGAFVTARYR